MQTLEATIAEDVKRTGWSFDTWHQDKEPENLEHAIKQLIIAARLYHRECDRIVPEADERLLGAATRLGNLLGDERLKSNEPFSKTPVM